MVSRSAQAKKAAEALKISYDGGPNAKASSEALLAEAKAESIKAQKAAVAMQEASRALREEMARKAQ